MLLLLLLMLSLVMFAVMVVVDGGVVLFLLSSDVVFDKEFVFSHRVLIIFTPITSYFEHLILDVAKDGLLPK